MKGKKMATTTVSPATLKVAKKRVFDLEKFEKVTVEQQYESPAPITKVDEILGMEESKLLAIVNEGLARQAWKEARANISGASPKAVNQFVSVFRGLPPYSNLLDGLDEGTEAYKTARKSQTQAIYAVIRSTPTIIDSLRQSAAVGSDDDDEENDAE